jgi:hypothetical protein
MCFGECPPRPHSIRCAYPAKSRADAICSFANGSDPFCESESFRPSAKKTTRRFRSVFRMSQGRWWPPLMFTNAPTQESICRKRLTLNYLVSYVVPSLPWYTDRFHIKNGSTKGVSLPHIPSQRDPAGTNPLQRRRSRPRCRLWRLASLGRVRSCSRPPRWVGCPFLRRTRICLITCCTRRCAGPVRQPPHRCEWLERMPC